MKKTSPLVWFGIVLVIALLFVVNYTIKQPSDIHIAGAGCEPYDFESLDLKSIMSGESEPMQSEVSE